MKESQFPHVCTQIAGLSVNDFFAAFPADAAENSAPTVIARWCGDEWKFIARINGFLFAKMHVDAAGNLWVFTGKELACYTPEGRKKAVVKTAEPIMADDMVAGRDGSWNILHSSTRMLTASGKSQSESALVAKGDLTSLCADKQGRFWAAGNSRSLLSFTNIGKEKPLLVCHDGKSKKIIAVPAQSGSINCLTMFSTGELAVSVFKGGLFCADAEQLWMKKTSLKPLPATEIVTSLVDDLNGGLYALNANTLFHLNSDRQKWESSVVKVGGKKRALRCVKAMPDGLVVGTYQGVVIGPKWKQLPMPPS